MAQARVDSVELDPREDYSIDRSVVEENPSNAELGASHGDLNERKLESVGKNRIHRKWLTIAVHIGVVVLALLIGIIIGYFSNDSGDSGDNSGGTSDTGFASLPARDTVLTNIAFGSCALQTYPHPFWDTLLSDRIQAQLFLFGGDNVYGDCRGDLTCKALQDAYEDLFTKPSFSYAKSKLPIMAVPDDHDYGLNDGDVNNPYKVIAKEMFLQYFQVSDDDPRRNRGGLYYSKSFGHSPNRVQVIMLDTRWFRGTFTKTDMPWTPGKEEYMASWSTEANATMLGAEQWRWLEQRFREPADIRLVLSTVQVLPIGHGFEKWMNFPQEVIKLIDIIERTKANGVVLLSGDRHIAAIYQISEVTRPDGSKRLRAAFTRSLAISLLSLF
ncbi:hypothetical protein AAMO2058_000241800 [Amorphochlora amoebiformis]